MSEAKLRRALDYPYPAVEQGYLFSAGHYRALDPETDLSSRIPVIAVGSNRSPQQLARKYGNHPDVHIPVTTVTLQDYDIVYSGYLTSYGSMPATIISAPSVRCHLYITWLDEPLLAKMHASESVGRNTTFGYLDGLNITSAGRVLTRVWTYLAHRGVFAPEGIMTALAAIRSENRCWDAREQPQMLAQVHQYWGQGVFNDWLLHHIDDEPARTRLNQVLSRVSRPIVLDNFYPQAL